tara:strand:+ start:961 stop:1251 length:291 start_codon:yes stop_codon:yes gene_type:complete
MATSISQSISDTDMLILKNDLWDINNQNNPMDNWVEGALTGKISNCYKRMKDEWVPKLMDDASISAISASKDEFVHQVVSHSSYQNRYQQESGSSV